MATTMQWSYIMRWLLSDISQYYNVPHILQDNVAADNEFIGVVTDATHHNVKDNVCQGNQPKCKGM